MRSLPTLSFTLLSFVLGPAALIGCGARTNLDPDDGGGRGGELSTGGGGHGGAGPVGGFGGFIGEGGEGGGGGAPPLEPTIISAMPGSLFEGETDVKSSPNGYVAAAWIGVDDSTGASFIGYAFSTDDGETWGPPQVAFTPDNKFASDPVITVDGEGGFWMTWVSYDADQQGVSNMVVEVAHAFPESTEFGPPVDAGLGDTFDIRDKPWITYSPENFGTLIVTYAEFTQTAFDMIALRSNDGINFERSVMAHNPGAVQRNLAFPCTSPEGGPVYAVWIALDNNGTKVEAVRSDDAGVTWTSPVRVSPPGHSVAFSDPTCSVDPSNGALLVSYGQTDNPLGKEEGFTAMLFSVELAVSIDGGVTFGPLATLSSSPELAMLPQLGFELGSFFVSYFQGQFEDDSNGRFVLSKAIELDTGFGSETIASPLLFTPNRASLQWLGDYTGMHVRNGTAYLTFVTNEEDGVSHVAFAKR